jgi:hypothetical protein
MVDIVDSGKGLSYRPANPCSLVAGPYDNPKPESTFSPYSETLNSATGFFFIENAQLQNFPETNIADLKKVK